jgi:RNA polymerase sigma-70 factor (ECF subfamily)
VFFSQLQPQDEEGDAPEHEFPATASVTEEVQDEERHEFIETALRALPEHQRVPLVLFHFEEMPYEEIASKLRVSLPKVKTDIHRARQALAGILARRGITASQLEA